MQNKTLIRLLWISTLIALSIVIIPYICKFGALNFSSSPESWGPFGDYVGGLLNPIIGILNLIVLTYLSINLVKEDTERNKWTIQELARPIASFHIYIGQKTAKIVIENAGLGPLIINKLKIVSSNNQEFDEFKSIIDNVREISYRP